MKLILYTASLFCFLHAVRDVLQIMGIKNKFTDFGHIWDKPEWEKYSVVIFIVLGTFLFYSAVS